MWRELAVGKDQSLHKAARGDGSWAKLLGMFEPEQVIGSGGACWGLAVVVLQAESPGSCLGAVAWNLPRESGNCPRKSGKRSLQGLVLTVALSQSGQAGPVGSALWLCLAGVNLTSASFSPHEVRLLHSLTQ